MGEERVLDGRARLLALMRQADGREMRRSDALLEIDHAKPRDGRQEDQDLAEQQEDGGQQQAAAPTSDRPQGGRAVDVVNGRPRASAAEPPPAPVIDEVQSAPSAGAWCSLAHWSLSFSAQS